MVESAAGSARTGSKPAGSPMSSANGVAPCDGLVAEHDRLETRDPGAERRLELLRTADQRLRATVPGHIHDLGRRQHDVDGIDDGTRLQHAVVADDPLPRVRRVERHTIARSDTEPHEAGRECARQRVELVERERPVADHQRAPVAKALGRRGQHLRKRSEHRGPSSPIASRRLSGGDGISSWQGTRAWAARPTGLRRRSRLAARHRALAELVGVTGALVEIVLAYELMTRDGPGNEATARPLR